ncbi:MULTISPECIES: glycosyltransferase family 4 protein [unclassified Nostoc]|uniref:glycosyltransferase family 4 protein n=1 Tax=unclassified Nostoc TaxID=2593658 RepID=UPI002AD52A6F|nr:glycosyltransferase family 4 protein [Nostoc sp. DedQUE03]MDZ7972835.1 glycosyltransferase family 4 protein [Nostoc sp. DedQUE03]MDZ8045253.1 glycosyltransferase family 4 protein [Nostoc sp. DedQUE02]
MHIIVLENEVSSLRGGQELSLFDVCLGLHKRGHTITLLYTKEGNLLQQYRVFCTEIVKVNGFRIERKNIINSLQNFFIDTRKIKTTKDSIVYSNQYHNSFFAYTLALSKNIPFVCHLRLPPPQIKKLGLQWSIGMFGAKHLIAVSNQTKIDWIKQGFKEDKIEVVHNGINTDKFQPSTHVSILKNEWGISDDVEIISYIGRLDKEKGLETLIRSFSLFLKTHKNAKLLIAGKPLRHTEEYKKSLEDLTFELGIADSVKFLSHLTNPIPLYQISDVTVLTSLHSEPFGRAIIESMACGTPAIASRTGGIPEILTGEFQKMLCEPGNVQDLADTLNFVLKWKNLDPQLSVKCQEHILRSFNVDKMVDGVEKVILKFKN